MPTHHMMEHDEHSPCKTSEHKHYTPTRCSAKRKQEQVNLFQTKLEIEIFKDVILPKIFYLYLDKVYTRRSYFCTKGEKIVLHRSWTNTPSSWQQKWTSTVQKWTSASNLHNFRFPNDMKAYEDIFESSSSLLSNASSLISFGLRNQELCLD